MQNLLEHLDEVIEADRGSIGAYAPPPFGDQRTREVAIEGGREDHEEQEEAGGAKRKREEGSRRRRAKVTTKKKKKKKRKKKAPSAKDRDDALTRKARRRNSRLDGLPRDAQGKLILPCQIGPHIRLVALGVLKDRSEAGGAWFCVPEDVSIPLGLVVERTFRSAKDPMLKTWWRCEVLEAGGRPRFRVYDTQSPDVKFEDESMSKVWNAANEHTRGRSVSTVLSGARYCGFNNVILKSLIGRMQRAEPAQEQSRRRSKRRSAAAANERLEKQFEQEEAEEEEESSSSEVSSSSSESSDSSSSSSSSDSSSSSSSE